MPEANKNLRQSGWTLLTGGASGIGLACAESLAQAGHALVLLDMDRERLTAAEERLRAHGVQVRGVVADVTDTQGLERIATELDEQGVRVRRMVTAAGILQPMQPIEQLDRAIHDRVWAVNYHGTYDCCRIWGERMRSHGSGAIVTVSSITAMRATPLLAYGPAKAALGALTASLSVSYAPDAVRINAVAPGFTLTEALQEKFTSGQRDSSSILAHVPMGRFAKPAEIAAAVSFLLSDASSAITGITLPVDCGWLAGSSWGTYQPLPGSGGH